MRRDIGRLAGADFQGRGVGCVGHERTVDWLAGRLGAMGMAPSRRPFEGPGLVRLAGPPQVAVLDQAGRADRQLAYRRDFVEHVRSAPSPGRAGTVVPGTEVAATGNWIAAIEGPRDLARLVSEGLARGAAGVLLPRPLGPDGYFAKQPTSAPWLDLPLIEMPAELIRGLHGRQIRVTISRERVPSRGTNVVAALPGDDALRPLLFTAHFDGVGDDPGVRLPGAGDNASGAALVLELARVLASSPRRGRRPVAFALLDAEEYGALGSLAHAQEVAAATPPLVVNLDMTARYREAAVIEVGPGSEELVDAIDGAGRVLGTPLVSGNVASDNRRYAAVGVPALGVATGAHGYHSPADTADRVETAALRRAGDLILETARRLAA